MPTLMTIATLLQQAIEYGNWAMVQEAIQLLMEIDEFTMNEETYD